MTSKLTSDERLVKILSETQATIMEHNSRCVRGSVEVDARLFESMIMELQERRKAAMDGEPVAYIDKQWTLVYYIPPMSMGLKIGDKLYRHAQPAPVVQLVPEEPPEHLLPKGNGRDATYRRGAAIQAWKQCRAAMLQAGNSPVIPDGYVMVPKEPTQAMCAAFNDSDYGRKSLRERYVAMLAAAPQEVK